MTATQAPTAEEVAYARILKRSRREGPVVNGQRCLVHTGARTSQNYGEVRVGSKVVTTHKLAWTVLHGPVPEGIHVLHHCDNPPCFEDAHLFLGDHSANMLDALKKGRNGRAKLDAEKVRELRAARAEGATAPALAKRFGISIRAVFKILSGESWSWVE